jgi:hypothetical protein
MQALRIPIWLLRLKFINREPRIAGMCIGLLFGGMMSPFAIIATWQMAFVLDGEKTTARVVSKHMAARRAQPKGLASATVLLAHGKRGPQHMLAFEYIDSAGVRHSGVGRTSAEAWAKVQPGDEIPVRYVRSNPARYQVEAAVWSFWPTIPLGLMSLAVIAGSLGVGWRGLRWVNQQVRYTRFGDALPGLLTSANVEWRGTRRKEAICVLKYQYAAGENLIAGTVEMKGRPRPEWQTGHGIVVLVDPNDLEQHAVDLFDARQADRFRLFGDAGRPAMLPESHH